MTVTALNNTIIAHITNGDVAIEIDYSMNSPLTLSLLIFQPPMSCAPKTNKFVEADTENYGTDKCIYHPVRAKRFKRRNENKLQRNVIQ